MPWIQQALTNGFSYSGTEILIEQEVLSGGADNSGYISGVIREVYTFLSEFPQKGQTILIMRCEVVHCLKMIIYNIVITSIISIFGIIFSRIRI